VQDVTIRLEKDHQLCPEAGYPLNNDETHDAEITFRSEIGLPDSKSWAVRLKAKFRRQREEAKTYAERHKLMEEYTRAKQLGEYHPRTIADWFWVLTFPFL